MVYLTAFHLLDSIQSYMHVSPAPVISLLRIRRTSSTGDQNDLIPKRTIMNGSRGGGGGTPKNLDRGVPVKVWNPDPIKK